VIQPDAEGLTEGWFGEDGKRPGAVGREGMEQVYGRLLTFFRGCGLSE
jgi:hypothetical protein